MPITFNCPSCGQPMQAEDQHAGMQVRCPQCQTITTVPGQPIAAAPLQPPMAGPGFQPGFPPGQLDTARTSGLAIAALVCALIPCLFPVGILLAIIAIVMIGRRPTALRGMGLAIAALVVGVLAMPMICLLISIMLPSLGQAREMARRARCAANLRGFSNTFRIYASAYSDKMPAVGVGATPTRDSGNSGTLDTQASLWKLVTEMLTSLEALICPSDTGNTVTFTGRLSKYSANPTPPFPECDSQGNPTVGGGYRCWSYSYQIPQDDVGRIDTCDPNASTFAIMADRAPYAEDLTLADPSQASTREQAETWLRKQKGEVRVKINSPNHSGEGQNVLFQDGHAEWCRSPFVGVRDDNIYTKAGPNWDTTPADRMVGSVPPARLTKGHGPTSEDDSLLCNYLFGEARSKTKFGGN